MNYRVMLNLGVILAFRKVQPMPGMAETIILALEEKYEKFTLGRELTVKQIEIIGKLAVKHGFKLAGFRSFEKAITPSENAIIKEKATARLNEARRNKVIS